MLGFRETNTMELTINLDGFNFVPKQNETVHIRGLLLSVLWIYSSRLEPLYLLLAPPCDKISKHQQDTNDNEKLDSQLPPKLSVGTD